MWQMKSPGQKFRQKCSLTFSATGKMKTIVFAGKDFSFRSLRGVATSRMSYIVGIRVVMEIPGVLRPADIGFAARLSIPM
jgi:hypothetical protein